MPDSVFPPLITVIIVGVSVCADHFELFIGDWMVQNRKQVRSLALPAIPYLFAVNVLRFIQASAGRQHVAFSLILIISFLAAFYYWLYLFCRSKQAELIMTNVA
jgi:hypothetical protein